MAAYNLDQPSEDDVTNSRTMRAATWIVGAWATAVILYFGYYLALYFVWLAKQ